MESRELPLVSIVIAAFNAERFIAETLRSILSQGYPRLEVIVVDDGSVDGTGREVAGFRDQVVYVRQSNSGGGAAPRNVGAKLATGDFICFFDADDIMLPGRIHRQVEFLIAHPDAVAVVMNYRNFSATGDYAGAHFETCLALMQALEGRKQSVLSTGCVRELLIQENFAITGGVLHRAQIFSDSGGFDQSLFIGEDLELLYRISRFGGIGVINEVGFRRRLHESNISNREEFNLRGKICSRLKMLQGEADQARRSQIASRIAEVHLSLADFLSRRSPAKSLGALWDGREFGIRVFSPGAVKIAIKCFLSGMRLIGRIR